MKSVRNQDKYYIIPFILKSVRCKLMYSDIKLISGYLEIVVLAGRGMRKDLKGAPGNFGGERYVYYLDYGDGLIGVYKCQHLPYKCRSHFTCSLMCVNFILIEGLLTR